MYVKITKNCFFVVKSDADYFVQPNPAGKSPKLFMRGNVPMFLIHFLHPQLACTFSNFCCNDNNSSCEEKGGPAFPLIIH